MKARISLKGLLIASFGSLSLILVVAYSMISTEYYIRGLDASMANSMEKAARSFSRLVGEEGRRQGREFSGFHLTSDWEHTPAWVRASFSRPAQPLILYKQTEGHWFQPPDKLMFLMRYDAPTGPLYVSQRMVAPTKSSRIHTIARENRELMLFVSLLALAFVGLISGLLLRHVSGPMKALRQWTRSLDRDSLADPVPDFAYPELNELAELIRASLSSVQAALEREQRFLRHASHELRTPISTIRSNIELQRKLDAREDSSGTHKATLERIDRASLTMQHLTEILLWLNHQPDEPLHARPLALDELVQDLAAEMGYLLTGKPVEPRVSTHPFTCALPPIPARIVLGNLIRNAYQHCWHGAVEILQQEGRILIRNPLNGDDTDGSAVAAETGYGLGLELTHQLTQRLGWHYRQRVDAGYYQVELEVCR